MSPNIPNNTAYDAIVIGGGLAGLVTTIVLAKAGKKVLLIEKKQYPFHKVCGEYISNEVLPYLQSLGFNPFHYGAANITSLRVSTPKGKNFYMPLDLGGFGISRYTMDDALQQIAIENNAEILTGVKADDILFDNNKFTIKTFDGTTYESKFVITAHGKRDMLDKKLARPFIEKHTGFIGVKYHIQTDYPTHEIGLDNFEGGYCGITKIEEDRYNLCYLYKKTDSFFFKHISELEENVLFKNPTLKNIFRNARFLYERPEVINQVYFGKKEQTHNHILMCGDSAGLITPLCGNGMSMAISGAKLLAELLLHSGLLEKQHINVTRRLQLETVYQRKWNVLFGRRLYWGRVIQKCFGTPLLTDIFIQAAYHTPFKSWLLKQTHGTVVQV